MRSLPPPGSSCYLTLMSWEWEPEEGGWGWLLLSGLSDSRVVAVGRGAAYQ